MDSAQRNYLATHILSEQATVSYRSVARALKVHVNAAKRMLYEFHAHENGKKPGSLYATYLLAGLKMPASNPGFSNGHINGNSEDDDLMPSSPPPFTSSMLQSSQRSDANAQSGSVVPVKSIELVREESLEGKNVRLAQAWC
jgi:DNA polymerase delta subunit 3